MMKFLALFLALLMIWSLLTLSACSGDAGTDEKDDPSADPAEPQGKTDEDPVAPGEDPAVDPGEDDPADPAEESKYLDHLPETADYGGDVVMILGYNPNYFTIEDMDNFNDGDVIENSIYTRQTEVQDRFNVALTTDMVDVGGQSALTGKLTNDVSSGTGTYSMVQGDLKWHTSLCLQNMMLNLNALAPIDFSASYWNKNFNEAFAYKKTQFWAVGDIDIWLLRGAVAMVSNDEMMASKYPDFDLYQTVIDGNWTIEKLFELTDNVYDDTNGNSTKDEGDTFGLYYALGWNTGCIGVGAGYTIGAMDGSKYALHFDTPENQKVVDALQNLLFNNRGSFGVPEADLKYFKNNLTLFMQNHLSMMEELRDLPFDYSVAPLPKYSADGDYRTYCLELICVDGISAGVKSDRREEVATVMEAMASAGKKYLTEGYYEIALRTKYARNSNSYQTLEIVRSSIWIEFGIAWCGALQQIDTFLDQLTGNLSSAAASAQPKYDKILSGLYTNLKKAAEAAE